MVSTGSCCVVVTTVVVVGSCISPVTYRRQCLSVFHLPRDRLLQHKTTSIVGSYLTLTILAKPFAAATVSTL